MHDIAHIAEPPNGGGIEARSISELTHSPSLSLPECFPWARGLTYRRSMSGMAGCVHLMVSNLKYWSNGLLISRLKLSFAIAVVLGVFCVVGSAQQANQFRVKKSPPEKAPAKIAVNNKPTGTSAADANAKDLHAVEHDTAKTAKPEAAGKKTPGATFKPVKDKPNPPINFGGSSAKSPGTTNQGSNPYRGRLRQKHAHQ